MLGNRLRVGALGIAALPTLTLWILFLDPRPGDPAFTYGPPTSDNTAYDLVEALNLWYLVILAAIPAVIALIPFLFSFRGVVWVAALLLSAGCVYGFVLGDWFISWGYGLGGDLYSTFGLGLIAYGICYGLSAGLLLAASGNPGKGVLRSPGSFSGSGECREGG